jgi:hypothetical protein
VNNIVAARKDRDMADTPYDLRFSGPSGLSFETRIDAKAPARFMRSTLFSAAPG